MNAFDVDYWISVMYKYSLTPRTLDEKSQHALMYLFHLTDQIAPVGRDNRREFWITAKRGSVEDFRPYYDEDATEEELAAAMQEQYPKEEYWYKFVSVRRILVQICICAAHELSKGGVFWRSPERQAGFELE